MKKPAIAALIVATLLVLCLTGIAALRQWRTSAAAAPAPAPAPIQGTVALNQEQTASQVENAPVRVIRFASNAQRMPPFLVNDLSGGLISTASLRGKVVIVNFWATWCPPCREEIPEMIKLAHRYQGKLQIIGVSMDEEPAKQVAAFAKLVGMNYPIVMGSNAIAQEYGGIPALPTSYIVSPAGLVVQKHVGLQPLGLYNQEVRALLGMSVKAKVESFKDTGQIFLKNADLATTLPGVDMSGLTRAQKQIALKRMNTEHCTCGCNLTIAQCLISDQSCPRSLGLAQQIVREVRAGRTKQTQS